MSHFGSRKLARGKPIGATPAMRMTFGWKCKCGRNDSSLAFCSSCLTERPAKSMLRKGER